VVFIEASLPLLVIVLFPVSNTVFIFIFVFGSSGVVLGSLKLASGDSRLRLTRRFTSSI
jgi:hypothetical protein